MLEDAGRDYDRLLEKLDAQAGYIAEKMARLRASIARSRETDPSTLSVNGLGELQAQGPDLDRLCGEVEAQRALVRRLNEVLLRNSPPGRTKGVRHRVSRRRTPTTCWAPNLFAKRREAE